MAATTSGNRPTNNLLISQYLEYQRAKGLPMPQGAYEMPPGIGGRRAMPNVASYEKAMEGGGYSGLGKDQPKMHNFARSFIGDLSRGVMDEQMAAGGLPHDASMQEQMRTTGYGYLEQPLHIEAQRAGMPVGEAQGIMWHGFKGEAGKPMIQEINDAIERTHRLTGVPRSEIVRQAIIRKQMPLYTGAPLPPIMGEQQ